jgi:hypothetical protein
MKAIVLCLLLVQEAPKVAVTVDTSQAPEAVDWAAKAKALCEEWYPRIDAMLATKDFKPPASVKIVFKKTNGVAGTAGNRITVNSEWIAKHPEDFGMIIHELVHVVQSYPKADAMWLIDGIADYIRFWSFEPKPPAVRIDPAKSSYREGYRVTAAFLVWVEKERDKDIVARLHGALRKGAYTDGLWKEGSGKDLDALWREFVASR